MHLGIKNKTFALFGGSRGIGWATACALAEDGANVFILSRFPEQYQEKVNELAKLNGVNVKLEKCDVTNESSVKKASENLLNKCNQIHGVVITTHSEAHGPSFSKMSDEDWDDKYQNILMGSVRPCRSLIPHMIKMGGGSIVLTSAFSARSPRDSLFAYASQKAALINVTKNLAQTYGYDGIRTNCVCPGYIKTSRAKKRLKNIMELEKISESKAENKLIENISMNIGLNRLGQAREVGDVIAFLLSERASYTSGAVISIDGSASG